MSHSIYLRKDGRWEARLSLGTDENGKRKSRSFYGKSREEAEYKLLVSQQNPADEYAVTELTVRELAVEFLHTSSVRLKESTAANYRMKAEKHIIPAFGDIQCCMLKSKMVYQFVEQKLKSGLSARYIADILVLMKSMFRYASREYHIRNVMDGIIMPKCQKSETAIFSPEQQEILKQYIVNNPSLTTLGVALSLCTGVRIGELCALQWADIDLKKRILTIRKTIQRIQCPSGKKRTKLVITEPKSRSSCVTCSHSSSLTGISIYYRAKISLLFYFLFQITENICIKEFNQRNIKTITNYFYCCNSWVCADTIDDIFHR